MTAQEQLQLEKREVMLYERNSSADAKVDAEGEGGGVTAEPRFPCSPWLDHSETDVTLQPMEVHSEAEIYLQCMEDPRQ